VAGPLMFEEESTGFTNERICCSTVKQHCDKARKVLIERENNG
jgi:hypothetical protein